MPIRKRLQRRINTGALTDAQREHLLNGRIMFRLCEPYLGRPGYPFADDAHRRRVWFDNRNELLSEHISRRPGTRPSAWWTYEADEPRQLRGVYRDLIEQNGIPTEKEITGYRYGLQVGIDSAKSVFYESEVEYLKRCGLLVDTEVLRMQRNN